MKKLKWKRPCVITISSKEIQTFIKAAAYSGGGCPIALLACKRQSHLLKSGQGTGFLS